MAVEHLSDLACLEWVRFSQTRLAPESDETVRAHLEACPACRVKRDGFAKMERDMHPYGSPPPVDRFRRNARRVLLTAVALVVGYVASLIFS